MFWGCFGGFGRGEGGGRVRCFVVVFAILYNNREVSDIGYKIQSSGFRRRLKSEVNTRLLENLLVKTILSGL